jgi:hypothetical protein
MLVTENERSELDDTHESAEVVDFGIGVSSIEDA